MIVRCTKKLVPELGFRYQDLEPIPTVATPFEDWHANLLRIDRRKCLLLVDSTTLFTFLVPGILRKDLMPFGDLVKFHLTENLFAHEVDLNAVPLLLEDSATVFAPTNNRRVVGSMNEYAFLFKHHIAGAGGLGRTDIRALNRQMNETPMGTLGYDAAIDAVRQHFCTVH